LLFALTCSLLALVMMLCSPDVHKVPRFQWHVQVIHLHALIASSN